MENFKIYSDKKEITRIYDINDENLSTNLQQIVNATIVFDNPYHMGNILSNSGLNIEEMLKIINNNNNYLLVITNSKTKISEIKQLIIEGLENKPIFLSFKEYFKCKESGSDVYSRPKIEFHPYKLTDGQCLMFEKYPPPKNIEWRNYINEEYNNFYNVVYPKYIGKIIDPALYGEKETDFNPGMETIVRLNGCSELLKDAPKIKTILKYIISNDSSRHMIYTNTDSYYGIDLLSAILNFNTENFSKDVKDNYKIEHICIRITDSNDEVVNKLNLFNTEKNSDGTYKYKVLIVNKDFPYYLNNGSLSYINDITNYHILDVNLFEAYDILYKLYKLIHQKLYNLCSDFTLHLYYGINRDGSDTLEKIAISKMYEELKDNYTFYQERWESGYLIEVDDLNGNNNKFCVKVE